MQAHISLKRPLFIVCIASVVCSSVIIFFITLVVPVHGLESKLTYNKSTAVVKNQPKQVIKKIGLGLPVRLKIPNIKVNAAFEYVGLTPGGAMGVPKNPDNVAWYKPGQLPGAVGSAIIAGHFGPWKNRKGSVFDNLNKLKKGSLINVEDDNGVVTVFVVRELRMFGLNDDVSEVFGSRDDKAHLNLITCQGIWDKKKKMYSNRLVVFADRQEL